MFSKPMLAFFKLKMWGQKKKKGVTNDPQREDIESTNDMNYIEIIQHYINLVKGRGYRHSKKFISDKMVALFFLVVCLIKEK